MKRIEEGTTKKCMECGEEFIPTTHLGRPYGQLSNAWKRRKFCSKICSSRNTVRGSKRALGKRWKLNLEIRKNRSIRAKKGKASHAWINGNSSVYKSHYNNFEYRIWREGVFKRDGFKCVLCGYTGYITAHHIKSFCNYPELRYELSNGVTLCENCHSQTDNYKCKAKKELVYVNR